MYQFRFIHRLINESNFATSDSIEISFKMRRNTRSRYHTEEGDAIWNFR